MSNGITKNIHVVPRDFHSNQKLVVASQFCDQYIRTQKARSFDCVGEF